MNVPILGIDLGTTFSSAAYIDEATGFPTAIETCDGSPYLASVVELEAGIVKSVGAVALSKWFVDPVHVVRTVKRAMGNPEYRFEGLSAPEISAAILRTLKKDAEQRFGAPVQKAVITCPAYFATTEREATIEAGRLAGLAVDTLVDEPVAAAIYFGINYMNDGERVLVCDLGGGTYDATILHYINGKFEQLDTTGDHDMGGYDWTTDLMSMVQERFHAATGLDMKDDLTASQVLFEECEKAKREFARSATVSVRCATQGSSQDIAIGRDEFETATEWRMQHLAAITVKALDKAGLRWSDLQKILLVGGSSRLRRMAGVLEEVSGVKPQVSNEPDLSVAYGAACMAAGQVRRKHRPGMVLTQKQAPVLVVFQRSLPRSLGTRTIIWEQNQPRITNSLIIRHGTPVPEAGLAESRDDLTISSDGQAFIDVPVVEFESDTDYSFRGNFRFTCQRAMRRGDRIKLTFRYDKNAISQVEAVDVQTGQPLSRSQVPYVDPDLTACPPPAQPRLVVFCIDVSGSMENSGKLQNAQQGVIDNARLLLSGPSANQVALVTFSSDARVVCPPTTDLGAIERAVQSMRVENTTDMEAGLLSALSVAVTGPGEATRDIVLVTDGMPDDKSAALGAARKATSQGIKLFMLGVGQTDVDLDFLRQMSPHALVVDPSASLSNLILNILTQSSSAR